MVDMLLIFRRLSSHWKMLYQLPRKFRAPPCKNYWSLANSQDLEWCSAGRPYKILQTRTKNSLYILLSLLQLSPSLHLGIVLSGKEIWNPYRAGNPIDSKKPKCIYDCNEERTTASCKEYCLFIWFSMLTWITAYRKSFILTFFLFFTKYF